MKRRLKISWLTGLAGLALLIATAGVWSAAKTVQAQTALMKIVPASQSVDLSGGQFTVQVLAEQVDDPNGLAAFEFKLVYDPEVIRLVGVEEGPFLGSSGRSVHCSRSRHSTPGIEDIQFGCVTLNAGPPWGPTGSGLLATVTFAPRAGGTTSLDMTQVQMVRVIPAHNPPDESLPVVGQVGSVTVTGAGPEPTPKPNEPTPIPTFVAPTGPAPTATPAGGPWWLTPEPGQTPMTRPVDSSVTIGTNTGSSASPSEGTSGGSARGTTGNSPRAGEGPPEKDAAWWPALAGGLLAISGAALIPLALYLRRTETRRPARR